MRPGDGAAECSAPGPCDSNDSHSHLQLGATMPRSATRPPTTARVCTPDDPLYLDPAVRGELLRLLENPQLLHSWTAAFGSPLNVVLPDEIATNAARFADVLIRHRIRGEV